MIVFGAIEKLTIRWVHLVVVLGVLDVKVVDPTELAVDIPLFGQFRIVRHPGALHVIFFIRVELPLRVKQDTLLVLEVFVKILLKQQGGNQSQKQNEVKLNTL